MPVVFCGICPHPPIMVPEVGRGRDGEVAKTKEAMLELGRRVKQSGAETLVMITPHGTVFADAVAVNTLPELRGDLAQFGAPEVRFAVPADVELVREIKNAAGAKKIPVAGVDDKTAARHGLRAELDHGITAPLYFIRRAGVNLPLVHVSMGMLPYAQLYSFGAAVSEAARRLNRKVAVLASGDLSHRLTPDAPAGYDPAGKDFDRRMVELVGAADAEGICSLDDELVERAGECGLRPIIMMLGALDGLAVKSEVLSYEGPFGVGYMVAALQPGGPEEQRRLGGKLWRGRERAGESYPVQVARRALERYFAGERDKLCDLEGAPPEFAGRRAGVFVSLKKHGQLRGCIGTIAPTRDSIVEEIAANAVSAAVNDPRFYPVRPEELPELDISVDILGEPEPVPSMDELDPKKYGVIVSAGGRRGLLLPDLEGIDTAAEQVAIARQKAGIEPGVPVRLERFTVTRYR